MKKCPKCKLNLNESDFYKDNRNCKKCHLENMKDYHSRNKEKVALINRKHKLKKNYNISIDDYNLMLSNQNGCCKICGTKELKRKGVKYFCVDHDHKNGNVRGLLCHDCNVLVGKLKDSLDLCKKVIQYLG